MSEAQHTVRTLGSSEDPMRAEVWHAWITRVAGPKLFTPIGEVGHGYGGVHSQGEPDPVQETLTEAHTDAEREVLLKLLADEEAKEHPPKNGILKPR
jgi:hypothetical protein